MCVGNKQLLNEIFILGAHAKASLSATALKPVFTD